MRNKNRKLIKYPTWVSMGISVGRLNNDSETRWNELFGHDSKAFIGNWNHFPVNVFLSIIITAAPIAVTLPVASGGPVLLLTIFGAVCPPLTPTTS